MSTKVGSGHRLGQRWLRFLQALNPSAQLLGVLRRFAENLKSSDELYITRPGFYADALRFLLRDRLQVLSSRIESNRSALRYVRSAARFPIAQLAEILWDKYDSNYFLRRRFTGGRKPSRNPVVLMPSAYVNVSRMAIAYASTVPEMDFLLVATRRSGWLAEPSANVTVAKLASYARYEAFTRRERDELSAQWRHVRTDLESIPEIGMLGRLGLLVWDFSILFPSFCARASQSEKPGVRYLKSSR